MSLIWSKHHLTVEQSEVLSLGLGFCPERPHILFDTIKDLNLFVHKLSLKTLHHKNDHSSSGTAALMHLSKVECRELRDLLLSESQELDSSPSPLIEAFDALSDPSLVLTPSLAETTTREPVDSLPDISDLKCKSRAFPPSTINKNAHLFLRMVSSEVATLHSQPCTSNLSEPHRLALSQLKTLEGVVIKPADKGGCVVVLDKDHYKRLCLDILEDSSWYRAIEFREADGYMLDFYSLIDGAFYNNLISKQLWEYMRTPFPRLPTFYCLPKSHKTVYLRGRPIVSGPGCLTEGASVFLDRLLWQKSHSRDVIL